MPSEKSLKDIFRVFHPSSTCKEVMVIDRGLGITAPSPQLMRSSAVWKIDIKVYFPVNWLKMDIS